jgi:hypothetical protein
MHDVRRRPDAAQRACQPESFIDVRRFGFDNETHAGRYLDALLARIDTSFEASAAFLDKAWAAFMRERLVENLALLRQP